MPDPLTFQEKVDMAHKLSRSVENRLAILSDKLVTGDITILDWQIGFRDELRKANALFLVIAAGGDKSQVNPDDWLKLGSELQSQYRYLENFADDILNGKVTGGAVATRAELYAGSAKTTFWRQITSQLEAEVDLPAQPGDGSTACLGRCYCYWTFAYEYDADGNVVAVLATWNLGNPPHGHCNDCPDRAEEWNPLRIEVAVTA